MMWEEFERIAGYEVSFEDYTNIIEPMYVAANMSKQDFVQCIDRKRFALKTETQLVREMRKEAQHLMKTCESYSDFESEHRLYALAEEYTSRFYRGLDYIIKRETYGDRFWNAPGRGCDFPSALVVFGRHEYTIIKELKLA